MKQLNFTERAAQSLNTGAKLQVITTELYDLYNHPEDIQLYVQIVGDDESNTPSIYIDNVALKDLHYVLSQLTNTALNNCIVWLQAYNGEIHQALATACEPQRDSFVINGCSFRLCSIAIWHSDYSRLSPNSVICLKEEVEEMIDKINNIINNH